MTIQQKTFAVNSFEKIFPFGAHLCREPMPPMPELKKDMENLRKHGFNMIHLQEHWMIDEPLEGQYDFSRYEEVVGYAEKIDLGVHLGLTCEQAPGWLWRKHPGCRMVGRNGAPIAYEAQTSIPADGKPGPCYDHPGAKADMLRFISRLVQVFGRFENIIAWNTWQEIDYWAEPIVGQPVCYCPATVEFFRQWLREKFGDLDALNRAWNTRYLDWSYVLPDRLNWKYPASRDSVAWNYFMDNIQMARILKARAAVIKENDPMKRPVLAHVAIPHWASGADWTYARCQDFLGISCYPAWLSVPESWDDAFRKDGKVYERHPALLNEMRDGVVYRFDHIRSCNRRGSKVWAAEFQGGPACPCFHKGRVPSGDDIRRWLLSAAGCGFTGISFWVTRAESIAAEDNGYSLLDSEGDSTERFEEAARVGQALNRHADLFGRPSWPGAKVGLVVNEWNWQLCRLFSPVQGGEHLKYSTRGWHFLLWEAGIPVDFVNTSELDEKHIAEYRALILPFPLLLSEETVKKLAAYVAQGGNLISEACPGRIDENGFAARGELSPEARKLFGVKQTSLTMIREPGNGTRWSRPERTWGEYLAPAMLSGCGPLKGGKLRANFYLETFECQGGEPCLMHKKSVAGVVKGEGRGRAWLLGTFAGHNGAAYRDKASRAVILKLLAHCGVQPEHHGKLLLRKRVIKDKEAWIFTNPTEKTVVEKVNVKGWKQAEDLFGEKVKRTGDAVSLAVKSLDVKVLILARQDFLS